MYNVVIIAVYVRAARSKKIAVSPYYYIKGPSRDQIGRRTDGRRARIYIYIYIYIRRILHSSTISVGLAQARPNKLFEVKLIRIFKFTVLMQNRSCFTRKQTCNGKSTKHCTRTRHQLKMAAPAEVSKRRSNFRIRQF